MLLIALILACQVWTIGGSIPDVWDIVDPEDDFEVATKGICVSVSFTACEQIAKRRYGFEEKWRQMYRFTNSRTQNYPAGCHVYGPENNLRMYYNTNDNKKPGDCSPEKRCICVKGSVVDICTWNHKQDGDGKGEKGQKKLWQAGKKSERECVEQCEKERLTDPTINGVTRKTSNGFCWCEQEMYGFKQDNRYQSCFLGERTAASKWAGKNEKYRIKIDVGNTRNCEYKGYTPGGNVKTPERISAPTAKIHMSALVTVVTGSEYASGLGQNAAEAVKEFTGMFSDTIPKMAPVIGVYGVAFGIVKDKLTPTPQDILDSVNNAISDLANDVDRKIQNMVHYVDDKLKCQMKKLAEREFLQEFTAWLNCRRRTTKEDANNCQCDRAESLTSKRSTFAVEYARLKGKQYLSTTTLKEIEVKLTIFRDWANLLMLVLIALIRTWQVDPTEKGSKEFVRFKQDMQTQTKFFDEYYKLATKRLAQWHLGDAKFPYDRSSTCVKTVHCQTLKDYKECPTMPSGVYDCLWGRIVKTAEEATCSCVVNEADGQVCEVDLQVRTDGDEVWHEYDLPTSDRQEAVTMVAKDHLVDIAQDLQIFDNYPVYWKLWEEEVGVFNEKVWKAAAKWAAEQTYKGGWKPGAGRSDIEESSGSGSAEEEEDEEDEEKKKRMAKAWEEAKKDVAVLLKKIKEKRKKSNSSSSTNSSSVSDGDRKNAFICPY